ncbi:hypothetical protein FQN50_009642 [Emmonsiellopsis sp. PD_5]|nr:hypothetical protein FQN50_009642 [Emmonsiellopsis sp. PD_5]
MESQQPSPRGKRPSRHKPLRTNEAWDKVVCTIEDLKLQGTLSGAQAKSVTEAVNVLKTTQTSARRKKYKRFLYNVLRESGPQAVLICAAALGQVKAADMKELDRNLLIRQIKGFKDINHSTIRSLAICYQIPHSESDVLASVLPLPQTPLPIDGSQNPQANDSVVISDTVNPAPQKQQSTQSSHYQDEQIPLGSEQIPGNLVLPQEDRYWSFSCMGRHMVKNLPEPFHTGMKMSSLWKEEKKRGGLAITNCLSIQLPKTLNEDALCVVRIGYDDGFRICNMFGFGDADIPV